MHRMETGDAHPPEVDDIEPDAVEEGVPAAEEPIVEEAPAAADAGDGDEETADVGDSDGVVLVTQESQRDAEQAARNADREERVAAKRDPAARRLDAVAAAARRRAERKPGGPVRSELQERIAGLEAKLDAALGSGASVVARATSPELPPDQTVRPEHVPDAHPEVAAAITRLNALGPKPASGDFADFDAFETARDEWLEKRGAARSDISSVRRDVARSLTTAREAAFRDAHTAHSRFQISESQARVRHADYDTVVADATKNPVIVAPWMANAVLESDLGGELKYFVMTNREEAARISQLPEKQGLMALGVVEHGIRQALGRPAAVRQAPRSAANGQFVRVSNAPKPTGSDLGGRAGNGRVLSLDDPRISQAEYNRRRNEMDVAKHGHVRR